MKLSRLIVWTLAAALFAFAVSGCTSQAEWQASLMSARLGYEIGDGSYDSRGGKANNDNDYQAVTVSIEPFKLWAWKAEAEINARATVEAQYAQRPPPVCPPCPNPPPCPGRPK